MTKRNRKRHKSKEPRGKRLSIGIFLTVIGLVISVSFNLFQLYIQKPKLDELSEIKQNFPMVQYYSEALSISKAIPLPDPLETTKNLDYFPTALL